MERKEVIAWVGLALFTVVVHLFHLGMMPLIADESIRALVSFEMIQQDNYIVPTTWGEFYYRKPPLYNWIIIGFFRLFGSYDLFVFRLPSVLSLFLLGGSIWSIARKHMTQYAALLAAFGFVLSGRLLTRDSMLGHIDLTFSLVTFLGFYIVFYAYRDKRWWTLFLLSYFLAAAATLMKGLPSILFQGATLVVWFGYKRNWKKLFSLQHLAGILVYVALVGGYFWWYSSYNSLETYFTELYDQAAMRTVAERAWYEGVVQLFTFPFENFGHLFPTSLFLLYMFRRGTIKRWFKDDFFAFTFLVLAINVIPYWLSPGYFPRYLFMLYPLLFILGAESFEFGRMDRPRLQHWIMRIFLIALGLLTISPLAIFWVDGLTDLPGVKVGVFVSIGLGLLLLFLWWRNAVSRLILSLAAVALFRLQFDLFIIPHRVYLEDSRPVLVQRKAKEIMELTQGRPVRVYSDSPVYRDYGYYIGVAKGDLINKTMEIEPGTDYIVDKNLDASFVAFDTNIIQRFPAYYEKYQLKLVRVNAKKRR